MNATHTQASNTADASLCNQLHNSANDNLCNRLHGSLDDRVAFYADAARSSATRRAYASDMAAFSAWGGRVPASPETVASYLAASDSLAAATLRRRLAAIADAHQALGHPDPTKHPLVRTVFRGIRRVHGARTDAATPLDIDMLARIIAALPDDLTAVRDRALLLVGFFCALRRSEIVALAVEDLDRRPDGWIVNIRRSKTDPYGRGQYAPLPAFHGPLCPTAAVADWLAIAAIAEGRSSERSVPTTKSDLPCLPPRLDVLRTRAGQSRPRCSASLGSFPTLWICRKCDTRGHRRCPDPGRHPPSNAWRPSTLRTHGRAALDSPVTRVRPRCSDCGVTLRLR